MGCGCGRGRGGCSCCGGDSGGGKPPEATPQDLAELERRGKRDLQAVREQLGRGSATA